MYVVPLSGMVKLAKDDSRPDLRALVPVPISNSVPCLKITLKGLKVFDM